MSPFKVFLHRRARRELQHEPKYIINKISEFLNVLAHDPIPHDSYYVRRIKGECDVYRVRLDNVRVVYMRPAHYFKGRSEIRKEVHHVNIK